MLNPFGNQPTLELSVDQVRSKKMTPVLGVFEAESLLIISTFGQTTLFLHPTSCSCSSSSNSNPCPSDDQLLTGSVKLSLLNPRCIEPNNLRVKLESRSSYNAGGIWHHEEDLGLKIELKLGKGETLEAGEYM